MRHLFILCLCVTSLTACATSQPPAYVSLTTQAITLPALSSQDSLAVMSLDNGVAPCPRFMDNLNAAETILNAQPKQYPHML
jgi:hypothetical protein